MNRNSPIIIIEDDADDQLIFEDVFKDLGYINELYFFPGGQEALDFLNNSDIIPFLIISDVNMPKLDGFALRDKIKMDAQLQLRCIPYLFFSTSITQDAVIKAYSMAVQGFFKKTDTITELKHIISAIMTYWSCCAAPNNFINEVSPQKSP